jgi:putative salt-induced outer membrane protein
MPGGPDSVRTRRESKKRTEPRKEYYMKKKILFIAIVFIGLGVAAATSFAEEKSEKALSDEGEVSYVQTDGNTKVSTLSAKNQLKYQFNERLLGTWKAGATSAETSNVKTAESYNTDLKLDYQNTRRLYSFVNAGWEQNKFAGVDEHTYGGAGVGYKFLVGPANFLVGELGVQYVTEKYTDTTKDDHAGGRAFAKYEYAFTEKNKFTQSLEYLNNFDDSEKYNVNSETAVISAINGNFSLKAAYVVNYTNAPVPETLKKKDSTSTVALVVNY